MYTHIFYCSQLGHSYADYPMISHMASWTNSYLVRWFAHLNLHFERFFPAIHVWSPKGSKLDLSKNWLTYTRMMYIYIYAYIHIIYIYIHVYIIVGSVVWSFPHTFPRVPRLAWDWCTVFWSSSTPPWSSRGSVSHGRASHAGTPSCTVSFPSPFWLSTATWITWRPAWIESWVWKMVKHGETSVPLCFLAQRNNGETDKRRVYWFMKRQYGRSHPMPPQHHFKLDICHQTILKVGFD